MVISVNDSIGTVRTKIETNSISDLYKHANKAEEKINLIAIGSEDYTNKTEVLPQFETLAHEYTHVFSDTIVGWEENPAYGKESGCINEAYSDLFGMIIDHELNNYQTFDWESARTNIANIAQWQKN